MPCVGVRDVGTAPDVNILSWHAQCVPANRSEISYQAVRSQNGVHTTSSLYGGDLIALSQSQRIWGDVPKLFSGMVFLHSVLFSGSSQ